MLIALTGLPAPASAQSLTATQRQDIRGVQRSLQDVSDQIEAGQSPPPPPSGSTRSRRTWTASSPGTGWSERDRTVVSLRRAIDRRREQIEEAKSAPAPSAPAPMKEPAVPDAAEPDPAPAPAMKARGGKGMAMRPDAPMTMTPAGQGGADEVFVRDVAPTFVNACGGCHAGNNPRGDFKLATFADLMESGYIDPGDPDASHVVRLMGGLDQPKMPPGNRRIRRSDYDKLRAWVAAGAKFSGDPNRPLRDLVPTADQERAAELAAMGDAAFDAVRAERAAAQFSLARPRDTAATHETARLRLVGNVPAGRLEQLGGWGEQIADELVPFVGEEQGSPFGRGKLTVFVMTDRFDYEEINLALLERNIPPTMTGHAVRTVAGADDYIALQDLRDDPTPTDPGMRANLAAQLAVAALTRGGWEPPGWLEDGFGLAIAAKGEPRNDFFRNLRDNRGALAGALGTVRTPGEIVTGEAFPSSVRPLAGMLMVEALFANGGPRRFVEFVGKLRASDMATALGEVYRTTPDRFATAFARSL